MPFSQTFGPFLRRVFAALVPTVSDWWLTGGISASNAIAVYQPVLASSLSASYTNLANPGTYDASPVAAPGWNSTRGWVFNGSTHRLTTGVVPDDGSWSMIVYTRNYGGTVGYQCVAGTGDGTNRFYIIPANGTGDGLWGYGNGTATLTKRTNGVYCLAGPTGYYNGGEDDPSIGSFSSTSDAISIGARGDATWYFTGDVLAVAIYDKILSAAEVAAVTAAMQAISPIPNGLLIKDTFTEASATDLPVHIVDVVPEAAWWADNGTFTVSYSGYPNELRMPEEKFAYIDAGASDVIVSTDVTPTVGATYSGGGPIARASDYSNCWMAVIDANADTFSLVRFQSGGGSAVRQKSVTINHGTTYHVELSCQGTGITATLDGGNRLDYVSTFNQFNTLVGYRAGTHTMQADNFIVYSNDPAPSTNGLLYGLKSFWKMDEASGTAYDAHGSLDLSVQGNSIGNTTGKIYSTARTYYDSSSYLASADTSDYPASAATDWTAAAWIKPNSWPGSHLTAFAQAKMSTPAGWLLGGSYNTYWQAQHIHSLGGDPAQVAGDTGSWRLVVGRWSFIPGATKYEYISVDGAAWTSHAIYGTLTQYQGNPITIFADDANESPWNLTVGPAMFWERALTDAELAALYNSGAGLTYASFTNPNPWWLAGGVSAADCIYAYQPRMASSYANSLVNLNDPGTGNAAEGNAPDWDKWRGWTFYATNSDYLITPTAARGADFSVIVRFQNAAGNTQFMYGDASWPYEWNLRLRPGPGSDMVWTNDNSYTAASNGQYSGVMALSGYEAWFNSAYKGTASTGSGTQPSNYHYIGAQNVDNSPDSGMTNVDILAIAAYDRTLTAIEIAQITKAMEAL